MSFTHPIGDKCLYAIIRKPQEGKTFICLKSIKDDLDKNDGNVHLIVTMNTIKSNKQFFKRATKQFGDEVLVFNSKANKEEQQEYKHATQVNKVKQGIIIHNKKIIVMCAHPKRFGESIFEILELLEDSKTFSKNIIIHIDEAHAYIETYRKEIYKMNQYEIVSLINLYSATPHSLWNDEVTYKGLFENIFIIDVEEQYKIVKSDKYYGVKDCEHLLFTNSNTKSIDTFIPKEFINLWGSVKDKESTKEHLWYSDKFPFCIGNELKFLNYTIAVLEYLKEIDGINNNKFSYNFIPAYTRKLTHYAIMDKILNIFKNAIVIIINGEGTYSYMNSSSGIIVSNKLDDLIYEPSNQIYEFIKDYPNKPIFVTGFHCISMSVTLINSEIGNFNNVIFSHDHYINSPHILYQLCRFLFNYITWSKDEQRKIIKTKFICESNSVLNTCLEYEKQIEKINKEMSGSLRRIDEICGDIKFKKKRIPKENKYDALEPYCKTHTIKLSYRVEEGEVPIAIENKVKEDYKDFLGKELKGKSLPQKNEDGFYMCSTTSTPKVHENVTEWKTKIEKWKNTNNFAISSKPKFKYARVYVIYDKKENHKEYNWLLRKMEITDCTESREIMRKINEESI
jgi:hypothetical protein